MRTLPWLLLLTACAASTGGERVDLDVTVAGAGPVDAVPIGEGSLTLTRAELAVGPVYLWSQLPLSADAHAAGKLVGEAPDQVVVDVLTTEPLALEHGVGVAGTVAAAEIWLEPLEGSDTLLVEGTAERAGEELPFRAAITWSEPWMAGSDANVALLRRRLLGLPLDGELAEDTHVALTLDASAWFTAIGLDGLPDLEPDGDGVRTLTPESLTGRDLDQGVRRLQGGGWEAGLEGTPQGE